MALTKEQEREMKETEMSETENTLRRLGVAAKAGRDFRQAFKEWAECECDAPLCECPDMLTELHMAEAYLLDCLREANIEFRA